METTTYTIRPRPPLRAFALAAVLAVAGAALVVAAKIWSWHMAVIIVGVLLLVGSMGLITSALRVPLGLTVRVAFSEDGYSVEKAGQVRTGRWSEVTRVTSEPGHITFHLADEQRFHLLFAHEAREQQPELEADITRRLDNSRGYRPLI